MPEGCECRNVVEQLRIAVKGKTLFRIELTRMSSDELFNQLEQTYSLRIAPARRIEILQGSFPFEFPHAHLPIIQEQIRKSIGENHRHLLTLWPQVQSLFPSECLDVVCKGKQIFFFFANGVIMNSGLGMEGHWYIDRPDRYTDFGLTFGRVDGKFQIEELTVWYDDMLRYGNFRIFNQQQAAAKISEIGPDFLILSYPWAGIHPDVDRFLTGTNFHVRATPELFWQAISNPKRAKMPLCKFIMEQGYFSGVGNWIENEAAYYARISLFRELGRISRTESDNLFRSIVEIMRLGYSTGGLTHGTFLDPQHQKGTYTPMVYKRDGQLCPLGHPIERVKLPNGRSGFMVHNVQL